MMTKKEKEFAMFLAQAVVEAMKTTTVNPTSANEGKKTKTGRKSATPTATKYSTKIADYEPKQKDGNYIWGKKTDTIKSKHYMAMQKAYCYAVATKGQAITSDECFKMGLEVDYSEKGAYGKAKAEFKKKYVYTKKADR